MADNYKNVKLYSYDHPVILDAEENWWGTDEEGQIELTISIVLTAEGCSVDFDPWCLDPECSSTAVIPRSWGSIKKLYISSPN
jgi:hypothetical protein